MPKTYKTPWQRCQRVRTRSCSSGPTAEALSVFCTRPNQHRECNNRNLGQGSPWKNIHGDFSCHFRVAVSRSFVPFFWFPFLPTAECYSSNDPFQRDYPFHAKFKPSEHRPTNIFNE